MKRWWGCTYPVRACVNCSRLERILPRANWAICSGVRVPWTSACNICWADLPIRSLATDANLILASSSPFCKRAIVRVRSSMRLVRERVSSRKTRCQTGGIKLGRKRPIWSKSAIHSASLISVFRPGTALMCWALTTITSRCPSSRL